MQSDSFVRDLLEHEVELAAPSDGVITRLLEPPRRKRRTPTPTWLSLGLGSVAIVIALTLTSVLDAWSDDTPRGVGTLLLESGGTSGPGIPPGFFDLDLGGVHVGLDERGSASLDPRRAWRRPCEVALLTPSHTALAHKTACAGADNRPRWEVLISSGRGAATVQAGHFRRSTPVSRSSVAIGIPVAAATQPSGRAAVLTSVHGSARYPGDTRWVPRIWTSISLPHRDVQVSILAPNAAATAWLTGSIYVD